MEYRVIRTDAYLAHYGVKGMKWGVRRYQPYGEGGYNPKETKKKHRLSSKQKKILITVGAVAVTATLATYGVYKIKNLDPSTTAKAAGFLKNVGKTQISDIPETKQYDVMEDFKKWQNSHGIIASLDDPKYWPKGNSARADINKIIVPKAPKKLSDFEFYSAQRMDANGNRSNILIPKDKEGYAKAFASEMVKNTGGSQKEKDYRYWYDYIMGRLSWQ